MTLQGGKIKTPNRLWSARKRRGLGQKQIAFLIDKTKDEVSRYERGARLPGLRTILSLEIAYSAPIRVLFPDLYEQLLEEMRQRIETRTVTGAAHAELLADIQKGTDQYCVYEETLKGSGTSAMERSAVRDHVTRLARKLAGL